MSKLSIREICISEEIQSRLAPIITDYLDDKKSLIDALDWILMVIVNDQKNNLEASRYLWEGKHKKKIEIKDETLIINDLNHYLHPETSMVEGEEDAFGGYICRQCAIKMGAVPPQDHICTWHAGKCDFCSKEANLCHTTNWNWPEFPER